VAGGKGGSSIVLGRSRLGKGVSYRSDISLEDSRCQNFWPRRSFTVPHHLRRQSGPGLPPQVALRDSGQDLGDNLLCIPALAFNEC